MKKNLNKTALLLLIGLFSASASATTISLFTLPGGNSILQLEGAIAMDTGGGLATSAVRTIYYFSPDFGDMEINTHDFTGSTWPYVYVDGPLKIDDNISADITTANDGIGDFLLINGNPIYQFVGDLSARDANGNFGPWFFIEADGTPTQSTVVPIPAALPLLLSSLIGAGLFGRRRQR